MNNEIAAWIHNTTDVNALKVLKQAVDGRLNDLTYAREKSGAPAGSQSGQEFPINVQPTDVLRTGAMAPVMTGPGPAPTVLEQVKERQMVAARAEVAKRAEEAGPDQKAAALAAAQEGEDPEEAAEHGVKAAKEKAERGKRASEEADDKVEDAQAEQMAAQRQNTKASGSSKSK